MPLPTIPSQLAREILEDSTIPYRIVVNEKNSGGVFRQWLKGLSLARHDLIWVAETDDSTPTAASSAISCPPSRATTSWLAFGRISCIGPDGEPRDDLDGYFDPMENFSWGYSCVVPAFKAFSHDFAIRNVSQRLGAVFRKPTLSARSRTACCNISFAGDWYFYALAARGGAIAYCAARALLFPRQPREAPRAKSSSPTGISPSI